MNLWPFSRPKPSHKEVRYIHSSAREAREAQRAEANRRASINGQLAVYNATTTAEQRKADTEAYFARQRTQFKDRASRRERG